MAGRYRTLDEVVADLAALEARFLARQDRRCIFVTLYGVVSAAMRDRVAQGGFLDPPWVHRYAVTFAGFYRDALDSWDEGRTETVPRAWRLAFEAASTGTGLVLQDMLLGVNAHVNHDLPFALEQVSIDPDRQRRRVDHDAVNAVLASVTERATGRLAALYAPGLPALDECAGQLDEMVGLFSLQTARDSAWDSAVTLANARGDVERGLAARLIGTRAGLVARLLVTPSRNRVFMDACRRIEQGTGWHALVDASKGVELL